MVAHPKLKLTYFDMQGRAEAIRIVLHLGGVRFVDERLTKADFDVRKHGFPYDKVPVLQVDGDAIAETQGILRYVARLTGMYPVNDAVAAALVDEVLSAFEEFFDQMFRSSWKVDDADMIRRKREEILAGPWHPALQRIDARLQQIAEYPLFKDSKQIYVHEIITWDSLDLLKSGTLEHIPTDTTRSYSKMEAIYARIQALPEVQQWVDHQSNIRPKHLKLTYVDLHDQVEPVQLALFIGGISFHNEQLTREAFEAQRHTFPYTRLPVLSIDGRVVAHSFGLLRYAGTITGMYPVNDPLLAAKIDEVLGHVRELLESSRSSFLQHDQGTKRAMREKLARETIPASLDGLERRLIKWRTSAFTAGTMDAAVYAVGGDVMTIADLAIHSLVEFLRCELLEHVPASIVDGYTNVMAVHATVERHPRVVEWRGIHR